VKGRGSDRWWERRWWLWWGDIRRMRWARRRVNTMRLTEWRRELKCWTETRKICGPEGPHESAVHPFQKNSWLWQRSGIFGLRTFLEFASTSYIWNRQTDRLTNGTNTYCSRLEDDRRITVTMQSVSGRRCRWARPRRIYVVWRL